MTKAHHASACKITHHLAADNPLQNLPIAPFVSRTRQLMLARQSRRSHRTGGQRTGRVASELEVVSWEGKGRATLQESRGRCGGGLRMGLCTSTIRAGDGGFLGLMLRHLSAFDCRWQKLREPLKAPKDASSFDSRLSIKEASNDRILAENHHEEYQSSRRRLILENLERALVCYITLVQ